VRVDHGRFDIGMPQEFLNRPNVIPRFQQVGSEGVPQGVGGRTFADAGTQDGQLESPGDRTLVQMPAVLWRPTPRIVTSCQLNAIILSSSASILVVGGWTCGEAEEPHDHWQFGKDARAVPRSRVGLPGGSRVRSLASTTKICATRKGGVQPVAGWLMSRLCRLYCELDLLVCKAIYGNGLRRL